MDKDFRTRQGARTSKPAGRSTSFTSDFSSSQPKERKITKQNASRFASKSTPVSSKQSKSSNTGSKLAAVVGIIVKFLKYLVSPELLRSKKFQYLMLPILIILIAGGYGSYWWFYKQTSLFSATIKYKYIPISVAKTVSSTDGQLQTTKLSAEESTTAYADTTGQKATGGQATGSVSIFNPTTDIRVVPKGTVLTCISNVCNSLKYITDGDLNLGPGSSEDVRILAGDFGENYNVSAGAGRFKVGNFDPQAEILASNVKPIAGGTLKVMVKIVSKEDIAKAEEGALKDLKTRIVDKLKNDTSYNTTYTLAESSIAIEKTASTPDVAEGAEASIVNVTVSAKGVVDAFQKSQIDDILNHMKDESTPKGYYLDENFMKASSTIVSQSKEKIEVKVSLETIARPDFNIGEIKNKLAGKPYTKIDQQFATIEHVDSYTTDFEPKGLPKMFWKVPTDTNRIVIKILAVQ